jgi:hypothetical protein
MISALRSEAVNQAFEAILSACDSQQPFGKAQYFTRIGTLNKNSNWPKAFLLWIAAAAIGFCGGWVISAIGTEPDCDCNLTFALWMSAIFATFYLVIILIAIFSKRKTSDQN